MNRGAAKGKELDLIKMRVSPARVSIFCTN